ncbi:D-alanyl-D-alanine carboxypeptidase [bacterium 1XD8-76]|nr:D-alanyl-D-alanine carboxypeptidase [bacterium 1XD8-76]
MRIKKKKRIMALLLTVVSVILHGMAVSATEEEEAIPGQSQLPSGPDWAMDEDTAPEVVADSAILMDIDTGVILYEKNIHKRQYPASVTKLLTCLVAAENSELTDVVTFSREAVFGIERGSSNIGIDEGEQLTMEECYYGALLTSANEVSSGIAEHVGGSIEGFAEMMNAKVQELGGVDSHFVNANGLHDDNHYTSAYDMALIGQAFAQNKMLLDISGTAFYRLDATPMQKDEIELRNHHRMLPDCELGGRYPYEYTIGGKNGYTDIARLTLVTFAKKDGHRLVCVVLKDEAKPNHYLDTIALFDYGFACYDNPAVRAQIDEKAKALQPEEEETLPEENMADGDSETLTQEEMDARVDSLGKREDSAPEEVGEQGKEEDRPDRKRWSGSTILTIAVVLVVLAAAGTCCYIFYQSWLREQERKRRQAEIMARHRARKQRRND